MTLTKKQLLLLTLAVFGMSGFARASQADFVAAYNFTVRYLPRFQTYASQIAPGGVHNKLIGPASPMGPEYKAVVAINDDTLYTSSTIDLTDEPLILTLPAYPYIYSIIQVNGFGTVLKTGLAPTSAGGTYALVGPNYSGPLPTGVTKIKVSENWTQLAIRTDKYSYNATSSTYQDVRVAAETFRTSIKLKPLSEWLDDPTGGATEIKPLSYFGTPMKTAVDLLVQAETKQFLTTLQFAMASPSTTPLSSNDRALIRNFSARFVAAKIAARNGLTAGLSDICAGARAAHDAVLARWHSHTIGNNWVQFNNMGNWGSNYLDRAAGNLFIQYGNVAKAAYYAQAFRDDQSNILTGAGNKTYTITFAADQIPDYTRFWSITAYTSDAIELVENAANKYVVASYTPGLVKNLDGSITLTLKTIGDNETTVDPNVLPIPANRFSVMLRVYGPEGSAKKGTYIPPVVTPVE